MCSIKHFLYYVINHILIVGWSLFLSSSMFLIY